MALDTSIPLQTNPGNPLASLSSLVGLKAQQQQIQAGQMANQQSAINLQERQGVQGVLANIKKYQDPQGNVDFNKLVPDIMSVAPTTGSDVLGKVAQAQTAATLAHTQVNDLDAASRKTVGEALYSLKGQKPEVVQSTLQGLKESYPGLGGAVDYLGKYILAPHSADSAQLDSALDQAGRFVQSAPTQQDMSNPQGATVNDGQTTKVVSTKPGTAVPTGQVIPGTQATIQPGPTTPTVDQVGTQGVVGAPQADFSGLQGPGRAAALADIASREPGSPNAREAVNVMAGRPQGFIPSSLPAGQAQNISNNVDEMNRHFAGLQDQSAGAPLIEGLTGNIKSLATKAITGSNNDKLSFANGLLSMLPGKGQADNLKDATDLLEKNMAQLSLGSGGSTDAARALVQAARPNSHMSPEAIGEAADQVASQVRASMAMRNALQGYKMMSDPQGYANARQKLEKIADPRVFQFESADDAGRRKLLSNLTEADRTQLRQKIQAAEEMGLVK